MIMVSSSSTSSSSLPKSKVTLNFLSSTSAASNGLLKRDLNPSSGPTIPLLKSSLASFSSRRRLAICLPIRKSHSTSWHS